MNSIVFDGNNTLTIGETVFCGFPLTVTRQVFINRVLELLPSSSEFISDYTLSIGVCATDLGDNNCFHKVASVALTRRGGKIHVTSKTYIITGELLYTESDNDDVFNVGDAQYVAYKHAVAEYLYTAIEYQRGQYAQRFNRKFDQ